LKHRQISTRLHCAMTKNTATFVLASNATKRIINCTNYLELRNIGKYLYKIICKWENKVNGTKLEMEEWGLEL
jgi:hypothetical protein